MRRLHRFGEGGGEVEGGSGATSPTGLSSTHATADTNSISAVAVSSGGSCGGGTSSGSGGSGGSGSSGSGSSSSSSSSGNGSSSGGGGGGRSNSSDSGSSSISISISSSSSNNSSSSSSSGGGGGGGGGSSGSSGTDSTETGLRIDEAADTGSGGDNSHAPEQVSDGSSSHTSGSTAKWGAPVVTADGYYSCDWCGRLFGSGNGLGGHRRSCNYRPAGLQQVQASKLKQQRGPQRRDAQVAEQGLGHDQGPGLGQGEGDGLYHQHQAGRRAPPSYDEASTATSASAPSLYHAGTQQAGAFSSVPSSLPPGHKTPAGWEDRPLIGGGWKRRKIGTDKWAGQHYYCACGIRRRDHNGVACQKPENGVADVTVLEATAMATGTTAVNRVETGRNADQAGETAPIAPIDMAEAERGAGTSNAVPKWKLPCWCGRTFASQQSHAGHQKHCRSRPGVDDEAPHKRARTGR